MVIGKFANIIGLNEKYLYLAKYWFKFGAHIMSIVLA